MTAAKKPIAPVTVNGWKAFSADWTCQGVAFAPEATVTHDGVVKLCSSGLHFCEDPLDVLRYYSARTARFAPVVASEVSPEKGDDSKRVARTLTVGPGVSIAGLIEAAVKYRTDRAKPVAGSSTSADRKAATASGDQSIAHADGRDSRARGVVGVWLTLSEWSTDGLERIGVKAIRVDGKKILADTYYTLRGGKVVAA